MNLTTRTLAGASSSMGEMIFCSKGESVLVICVCMSGDGGW